jgi:hypothetical protein
MIVKCIENTGINLPTQLFSHPGWNNEMEFPEISLGKKYVVYAILYVEDHPFYMICGDCYDEEFVNYPDLLPGNLFEIIDNTNSKFWIIVKKGNFNFESGKNRNVGFKELLRDEFFYGNLVEGYENEVKIFSSIKKKIDEENGII